MTSTRDQLRRRESRRSTVAGLGGVVLIALGVVLQIVHLGGNLLPTVLAVAGLGCLIAGIATGSLLVLNNLRYRRDQSYYDEE